MVADDAIDKLHNSERAEAELSRQIKVKSPTTPYVPTQKEREDHNATHCPYRNWCSHCVAGKAPDPDHQRKMHDEEQVPVIEFDYNFAGDSIGDRNVTMLVAADSIHGSLTSPMVQKK